MIERRYVVREVKQRIHQAQFRGAVLPAYRDRCAICRLREVRLLDAAHIVADTEELGELGRLERPVLLLDPSSRLR